MKWLALVALLAACGRDQEMDTDQGVTADMTMPSEDMAMPAGDMAMAPETDDPLAAMTIGQAHAAYIYADTTTSDYIGEARFSVDVAESYSAQTTGPCKLFTVMSLDGGTSTVATPAMSGSVQLAGGAQTAVYTATDGGVGLTTMGAVRLWQGGETLTFSGAGGEPGTWSSVVTAPQTVTISQPSPSDAGVISINRTQDLHLMWTPGTSGFVTLVFYNVAGDLGLCTAHVSTGTLTVPATTLAIMPNQVAVFVATGRQISAGPWVIGVRAQTDAYDARGTQRFAATLVP